MNKNIKKSKSNYCIQSPSLTNFVNSTSTSDLEQEKCLSISEDSSYLIDNPYPKDENEDILINLSKKQRKLSDYSNDEGIAFSSRESILNWAEKVLGSVNLTEKEKESIFHRFSMCFDLVMDKLFIERQSITVEDDLKKMTITIFLLTYKFEGFTIGKVSIKNLVEAFLSSMNINNEELENTIQQTELNILALLDYNPFCLENNIYELSLILFDLLKKKFFISNNVINIIQNKLHESNKNVLISNKLLFETTPLDKAAISLTSIIMLMKKCFCDDMKNSVNSKLLYLEVENLDKNFFNYLKNELKILKIRNWNEFKNFCLYFEQQFEE